MKLFITFSLYCFAYDILNYMYDYNIVEFWGIRWNPIVGKLLQDSFYKPARRIGLSRSICMVICFIGKYILCSRNITHYYSTVQYSTYLNTQYPLIIY